MSRKDADERKPLWQISFFCNSPPFHQWSILVLITSLERSLLKVALKRQRPHQEQQRCICKKKAYHFRWRHFSDALLVQQKQGWQLKTGFFKHKRRLLAHMAARLRSRTLTEQATCKSQHAANILSVTKRHNSHPAGITIHQRLLRIDMCCLLVAVHED